MTLISKVIGCPGMGNAKKNMAKTILIIDFRGKI